jgi:predicted membrane-bound dolichyl-phosphate-mannose-protein mannosyltransferase
VTGPILGGTERDVRSPSRSTGLPGAFGAIVLVLALGLALRLIIAYLLPGSGFETDIGAFRAWADDLARNGPLGFYERPFFHDYTPGYLYVLWVVGLIGQATGGISDLLLKTPAILADIALGWLVWSMARELGAGQRPALIGAAIVVLNPVTWFDSVVWGQVDSFGAVFVLLALRELWRDRPERSAVFTVIAAVIKPQLGILIPLVAVVTIRRALRPPEDRGDDAGWEARTDRPVRILTTGLAGYVTAVLLSLPFGLSVFEPTSEPPFIRSGLLEQVAVAAGGYPYVTVNAYNPWALVPGDAGLSLASHGVWVCDAPAALLAEDCGAGAAVLGPVPAVLVGTALLLLSIALALWVAARHPDRRTLLVVLAVLAIAFFVVPTRVHERYMFPFFAIGAILAAVSVRWRIAYVLLSAATFANLYVVLTTLYPPSDPAVNPVRDWLGIGEAIRSPLGVTLVAVLHLIGFVWALGQLRRDGRERLEDELAEAAATDPPAEPPPPDPEPLVPTPPPVPLPAPAVAPTSPASVSSEAVAEGPAPAMPTWRRRAGLAEAGVVGWVRERLLDRPIRADRSRLLVGERGGRFDRLDVWLLIVLVVATMGLRTFRLGEPLQMHFDEVYHARTATEFLQHWRYGQSHDIYEWTHPHLAKYAIALGIVAWGDDRVSATSATGSPVRDAAIEPRRPDEFSERGVTGDRLHVVTGERLVTYDLRTRHVIGTVAIPGVSAVAADPSSPELVVGTEAGELLSVDLSRLDAVERPPPDEALEAFAVATIDGPIQRVLMTEDGLGIVAWSSDRVTAVDRLSGEIVGTAAIDGVTDVALAGTASGVTTIDGGPVDPAAAALRLAEIVGADAEELERRMAGAAGTVVVGIAGDDDRTAVQTAIDDGELAGLAIEDVPRIAVAGPTGLTFLDARSAARVSSIEIEGGAHGLAHVTGIDDPRLYVASGSPAEPTFTVVRIAGEGVQDGPVVTATQPMPGAGSRVVYDEPTRQVHILGRTQAGDGWTVYVVEPHGNAVYADATLPFEPSAWALDASPGYSTGDRQQLLVFAADGSVAAIETGQHAFAWRLPGVIAGVLMAACLYLLARMLFARRAVAIAVGLFVLVDGMLFAQSRIAMNDAYVGLFIIVAYTLFAGIWTGRWRRPWAFWAVMPAIGLALGLALASKWVAAYALGALGLLILARSALGRVLLIAGLILLTAVLGYMAISVPEGQGVGNVTFLLIMIALTLVAVIVSVVHPIAWSPEELRFAVVAPGALGAFVFFGALALGRLEEAVPLGPVAVTPLELAIALAAGSLVVYGLFRIAGSSGFGPLARTPAPDDPVRLLEPPAPAAPGWLRLGSGVGLPAAWMVVCLVAIPLGVYVLSYVPWAFVENHRIVEGWPAGHTGQTLVELTGQMYRYHNTLTAAHAASSPWWAWPFDLKPVWFYQGGFDGGTSAAIYDSGNLVIWWLGVPALAFVAWQAFRRRSLALALIAIGFAAQWIPWARIDRAAFQYHYYTALPFVVLALGYFVAELWHGASRATWLLARVAAGLAIMAPALLYLFARPLCWFVGVEAVNPGSAACPPVIPEFVLTVRTAAMALVVGGGALLVARNLVTLDQGDGAPADRRRSFILMAVAAAGAVVGFVLVAILPETPLLTLSGIPVEPIAFLALLPLGYLAMQVLAARDARRFAIAIGVAAVIAFVVFYPNLSALPLPGSIANAYQGLLPTYLYAFQFPVSTIDRTAETPLLTPMLAVLLAGLVVTAVVVAYSAWSWRITLAVEEAMERSDAAADADAMAPGPG